MEFPKPPLLIRKILTPLIGGILGFLYYRFVGCTNGTCPISSNPWISTLYGGILGYLIGSQFSRISPEKKRTDTL